MESVRCPIFNYRFAAAIEKATAHVSAMFGRNDALPVHGGSRKNNGVSLPAVNISVSMAVINFFPLFSHAKFRLRLVLLGSFSLF